MGLGCDEVEKIPGQSCILIKIPAVLREARRAHWRGFGFNAGEWLRRGRPGWWEGVGTGQVVRYWLYFKSGTV